MEHKFKVGDRVQFKSWEEMEKEFGITQFGDIPISPFYFTEQMKHLCNTCATISYIDGEDVGLINFSTNNKNRTIFGYCLDMIKPVKLSKSKVKPDKCDNLEDTLSYMKKHIKRLEPRYTSVITTVDDVDWSDEEQIKWHEECLKHLKEKQLEKKWVFTEDEKVILRNIDKQYKWLGRDVEGTLWFYDTKPVCPIGYGKAKYIDLFNHLFRCIKIQDEPCEFRKYI